MDKSGMFCRLRGWRYSTTKSLVAKMPVANPPQSFMFLWSRAPMTELASAA